MASLMPHQTTFLEGQLNRRSLRMRFMQTHSRQDGFCEAPRKNCSRSAVDQLTRSMQKSMTSISADFCGVVGQRRQRIAGDRRRNGGARPIVSCNRAVAGHQADRLFQIGVVADHRPRSRRVQKARSASVPRR